MSSLHTRDKALLLRWQLTAISSLQILLTLDWTFDTLSSYSCIKRKHNVYYNLFIIHIAIFNATTI